MNLKTARTIGVLFNTGGKPGELEQIQKLLDYLSDKNLKVDALCYLDTKKVPHYYLHLKNINVFSRSDLNWFYIPKRLCVKNFITSGYDLFIDLTTEKKLQLEYISALCNARFKVGRYDENNTIHDLMINTDISNMEHFIEQIKYFLTTINN